MPELNTKDNVAALRQTLVAVLRMADWALEEQRMLYEMAGRPASRGCRADIEATKGAFDALQRSVDMARVELDLAGKRLAQEEKRIRSAEGWRKGRIQKYDRLWTLRPDGKMIRKVGTDLRGRMMYLVRGPGVSCADLERWEANWPITRDGEASVSWAECKKCPQHNRGLCTLLAEQRARL